MTAGNTTRDDPGDLEALAELLTPQLVTDPSPDAELMRRSVAASLFDRAPAAPRISRYVLRRKLGAGGMGVVFEGHDELLGRRVAVKLLAVDAHRQGPQASARMLREARALARISHPNVVEVFEVGHHGEQIFIAMECINGRSLRDWVLSERPALEQIVDAYRQFARGIDEIHAAGLVHRDIKPSNAVIDDAGRVRLIDFGLARETGLPATQTGPEDEPSPPGADALTQSGAVLGTLSYMAPEQRLGEPATALSDQYSLCVSLYEAVTGARPSKRSPPGPSAKDLQRCPRALRSVLARGLAFDPSARWPSMRALEHRLAPTRSPAKWAAAAFVGLGLSVAAVIGVGREEDTETCAAPSPWIEGVWEHADRDRLARRLRSATIPEATVTRALEHLDAHAAAWERVRAAACRLDDGARAFDQVMQCLRAPRSAMQTLVERAEALEVDDAPRLVDASISLPDPQACLHPDARLRGLSDADRVRVAEVRAQLESTTTLGALGELEAAAQTLQTARVAASRVPFAPLKVEGHFAAGMIHRLRGELALAIEGFEQALWEAMSAGLDESVADAASQLAVTLTILGDAQGAQRNIRLATAAIERSGSDSPATAVVERARGALERQRGHLLEARDHFQAALEAGRDSRDPLRRWEHQDDLAAAESALGHHEVALALWEEAYEGKRPLFGEDHPSLLRNRLHRGLGHWQSGDSQRAQTLLEGVVEDAARLLGEHNELVAAASLNLAAVAGTAGRHEEALVHIQRGRAAYEAILPEDHPQLVLVLTSQGTAENATGSPEKARASFEEAVRISRRNGAVGVHLASVLINLAAIDRAQDQLDAAVRRAEEALAILEAHTEPGHPDRARALWVLGEAQRDLGRPEDALRTLSEALERAPPAGRAHDDAVAGTGFVLAKLLAERGRHDEAKARAEMSAQAYARLGKENDAQRVRDWLASKRR